MANTHHYDVIIIGAGPASCIAAALLCRKGWRVLTFACPPSKRPTALPLTPIAERLSTVFGGPTRSLRPAEGYQLITPDIRLDFHGARPLEEELRRELPESWEQVLRCLRQLDDWGRRLETLFLQPGKPPSLGLAGRLAFRRRLLLNGLASKGLARKFPALLAGLAVDRARQALLSLFAGLSLADPFRLSVAEAALLWHAAARPEVLDGKDFHIAIEHGIRHHPAQTRPLADFAELQGSEGRWQVVLRDGSRLGATHFILDQIPDPSLCPAKITAKLNYATTVSEHWQLSEFDAQPSALLARRVILAGNPPLLLTFTPQGEQGFHATVEAAGNLSQALPGPDELRRRLEPVLPFTRYRLNRRRLQVPLVPTRCEYPGLFGPKRLSSDILYCGIESRGGGLLDSHLPLSGWLTAEALTKKR